MTMNTSGKWLASVIGTVGVLQALDSGVLDAGNLVLALVAVALAGPVVALAINTGYGLQAASLAMMGVLLTLARIISPVSLNGLHIMMVPAALLIFTLYRPAAVEPE